MTATETPPELTARSKRGQGRGDRVFRGLALGAGLVIMAALAGVFIFLAVEGAPGFNLPSAIYFPKSSFLSFVGPLVFGTVLVAVVALVIAVPFSIGIALFIAIYAPRRIATPIAFIVDLLAAVPSVVFGLWGIISLAPHLLPVNQFLYDWFRWIPLFKGPPANIGGTMLAVGIVLAIMILPIITAITREIFAQTPRLHQEAAMALGATKWEMVRLTVFPYARSGMVSAIMLGLGRALGETMAVLIILSPGIRYSPNLISDGDNSGTIAGTIAQKFSEANPSTVNLLIASGLVLFALTFVVNFAARAVVARAERKVS